MEEMNHPEENQETYIPRPRWQVWGARVGLGIMAAAIASWLYSIAFPV